MKKRFLTVLMMVMAMGAQAKLPLNVIIAISEGLKPDCYFADPTWGLVWAETGLPSMRLYGNYDFAYDGLNRDYLKDKSATIIGATQDEPIPSTSTSTSTTVTKKANEKKDYLAELILLLCGGNINAGTNSKGSIIDKLTPDEVAKAINNLHDEKWQYFPLTKNKENFIECKNQEPGKNFKSKQKESEYNALEHKINGSKSGLPSGLKDFYIALCGVKQLEGSSLPRGFAEQQLLAFAEERFSTPDEAGKFYNALSKDFKRENKQSFEDLKVVHDYKVIKKNLAGEFENLRPCQVAHLIKLADLISAKTAYPIGAQLISNGSTYLFDGSSIREDRSTFQDCVDVSMRHIFNLLLWNGSDFTTNLNNLIQKDHNASSTSTVSPKGKLSFLSEFYTTVQSTKDSVNDGSIDTRSAWNKVVACLPEETKVNYCEGKKIFLEMSWTLVLSIWPT